MTCGIHVEIRKGFKFVGYWLVKYIQRKRLLVCKMVMLKCVFKISGCEVT